MHQIASISILYNFDNSMKKLSFPQHIGLAFLILVISYVLFTLLHPAILPHPEDFSPWAYVVAFLFILVACFRLPKQRGNWRYWFVLLLCTLALLDETGYGVEIFGWPPLYLPQYHLEIHDLHNLFNLGVQLASQQLDALHWNGGQFFAFGALDAALLMLAGLFLVAVRFGMARAKESAWQARILRLGSVFAAALGVVAALYLFTLPADPKNAFLFGHSLARLASAAFILVPSLLPLTFLTFKRSQFQKSIAQWHKKSHFAAEFPSILFVLMLLALVYQLVVPFVFLPDEIARFERITPLVLWLLAELFILWLAAMLWAGYFRKAFTDLFRDTVAALARQPAFVYAAFAILLIGIAQLIDTGIIPLNDWIKTPNFHVQLWGLWTEETFEMTAAYEFLAASLFFPRRKK